MTTKWQAVCAAALTLLASLGEPGAQAASRFSGSTDDSVCDVGRTDQRTRPNVEAFDFVKSRCKNGQLLTGSGPVPAGGYEPEIEALAKRYCRIADIEATRTEGSLAGIRVEFSQVRCKIGKHESS